MSPDQRRWIGRAAWLGVALPALGLLAAAATDRLGPDPVETLTHTTGDWGLRFLVLTLCVTPARRWLGLRWVAPLRRTFGLGAFGYACLHVTTYLVFEHFFDWSAIWEDVAERTWITAGFAAFVLMVPLAATSTRASMRRMGQRWVALHRLVYAAAVAAVAHFLWLVKADLREPLIYATTVGVLLGVRVYQRYGRRSG